VAHDLFVTRGYGRTTIADVAAEAGVAPETVYSAFKNKPGLLHRAWDVAVGGDDRDVPLLERPELRAVLAEPDLRTRFAAFAVFNTAAMRLHLAVRGAVASEPAAAAMLEEIDRRRLASMPGPPRAPGSWRWPKASAGTCCLDRPGEARLTLS
jgi:AcrR family transcriptional regulator